MVRWKEDDSRQVNKIWAARASLSLLDHPDIVLGYKTTDPFSWNPLETSKAIGVESIVELPAQ